MIHTLPTIESLAGLDRVLARLDRGEAFVAEDLIGGARPLVARLVRGATPREALLNLRRLIQATASPGSAAPWSSFPWPDEEEAMALEALASVLSSGPELTRLLLRRPARLELLVADDLGRARSAEDLRAELAGLIAAEAGQGEGDGSRLGAGGPLAADRLADVIGTFRNDHYVRLAAAEFGIFASLEQVGLELANVADVCLQAAMEQESARLSARHGPPRLDGGQPCGLAAMAMGKYGAQELNFCSDIDVVFVYTADEGAAGPMSLHEFFTAVCRGVVRALSAPTSEGVAFRVDLRLRPEGDGGPLCNALDSAERYYETWGGPYDRLAWLKARAAAGDPALGEEMLAILRPFVYRGHGLRDDIIDQIHHLSRRIRSELGAKPALVPGFNVKLGAGGIRDVEFFVQALQLVHGGRQPQLHERATLRALDKLLFVGLIGEQERQRLAESYELYRRIEHRLQLHGGRQTHLLPADGPLREQVVRHLGFDDEASFAERLGRCRAQVTAIYQTLGAPPEQDQDLLPLLDGSLALPDVDQGAAAAAEQGLERLRAAGFAEPEVALQQLRLLAERAWPFGRSPSEVARRLALPLLNEVAASPDPDAALRHLATLSLRFGHFDGLWRMFDDNREALRLLCSLFGSSDFLARMFINHPELFDQLLGAGHAQLEPSADRLRRVLARRLARVWNNGDGDGVGDAVSQADLGEQLGRLRRFRNEELLRVGLGDIAGDLTLEQVWRQLTTLADVILEAVYPLVLAEITRRYGRPLQGGGGAGDGPGGEAALAVLGLGKLGGAEMSYGSDLDLIFVYSDEGKTTGRPGAGDAVQNVITNGEFFARLAQRIVNALSADLAEGRLYEVDTRLRPSGSQGMLVVSRSALFDYHREHDETWQRQALIKARAVAGDDGLGRQVAEWIDDYLYGAAPDRDGLARDVASMRRRIERELAGEDSDFYNFKLGRGGLLDVEFAAQYLQLAFGAEIVQLRRQPTIEALRQARRATLIDDRQAAALVDGYHFLRRLESRLRIVRDRSAERLPASPAALEVVARRLGYRQQHEASAGSQLLDDYRGRTAAVRQAYEEIVGSDAQG